jgi:hypothetical protein
MQTARTRNGVWLLLGEVMVSALIAGGLIGCPGSSEPGAGGETGAASDSTTSAGSQTTNDAGDETLDSSGAIEGESTDATSATPPTQVTIVLRNESTVPVYYRYTVNSAGRLYGPESATAGVRVRDALGQAVNWYDPCARTSSCHEDGDVSACRGDLDRLIPIPQVPPPDYMICELAPDAEVSVVRQRVFADVVANEGCSTFGPLTQGPWTLTLPLQLNLLSKPLLNSVSDKAWIGWPVSEFERSATGTQCYYPTTFVPEHTLTLTVSQGDVAESGDGGRKLVFRYAPDAE